MPDQSVSISPATPADLPEVQAMLRDTPVAPQWPADTWRKFVEAATENPADQRDLLLVARGLRGRLVGWLAASGVAETVELEYVLVGADWRRAGVGRHLIEHWLTWAMAQNVQRALLEVRPSNQAARALYHQLGFVEQGRRRSYYQQPAEDALLLERALGAG